jgi:hypothetical protein
MSLDDELFGYREASRLAYEASETAINTLGYRKGREGINVFIAARKEYRTNHECPDIKDDRARSSYNRDMNVYAHNKVLEWVDEQTYARDTHPDGFKQVAQ